jgi:hypothetical protein
LNFKAKANHIYLAKGMWHEIFKKLNKNSHYARGDFSTSKVTFRSNRPMNPVKRIFLWCKNHSDEVLMISSNSCSKTPKVGTKVRSQPLQSKEIKISSAV